MKFLSSVFFLCVFSVTSAFADEQAEYEAYKKGLGDGTFEIKNYVLKDIEEDIKETIDICENIMAHQGTDNGDTATKLYRSIYKLQLKTKLNFNQKFPYLTDCNDIDFAFGRRDAEDFIRWLNDKYALYTEDEIFAIVKEANNLLPKNNSEDNRKQRRELLNLRILALYRYALRKDDIKFFMNNKKITDNLYYEKGYISKSRLEKALDSVDTEEKIKTIKIYSDKTSEFLRNLDFLTDAKIDSDRNLSDTLQAYNEFSFKMRVASDKYEQASLQERIKTHILPNMKKYSYEYSNNVYSLLETIAEAKIHEDWY